eukprot:m.349162 g.349162  ORF g.349162 m.349162 type:complete len:506 (+) comp20686_c0_seq2:160-1677(+)
MPFSWHQPWRCGCTLFRTSIASRTTFPHSTLSASSTRTKLLRIPTQRLRHSVQVVCDIRAEPTLRANSIASKYCSRHTMSGGTDIRESIAKVLRQPEIIQLREVFTSNGADLRLVGGAVRDLLSGEEIHDLDLASPATPDEIIEYLENAGIKVIATGLQHGTVTAVINHIPFEITTLRIDTDHDGRHCAVQYTKDWKLDAERRDLTVNAMMMDLDGVVYDYFNGREHLEQGWITFVGDPGQRIEEDNLRILRYFRFHGRISKNSDHDPVCIEAIRSRAEGLQRISGERIHMEMMKILQHPTCCRQLRAMHCADVLKNIALEVVGDAALLEVERVARHTSHPIVRLMALVDSEDTVMRLHERWKFTNKELQLALFIVEQRHRELSLARAKELLVRGRPLVCVAELLRYKELTDITTAIEQWEVPKFPVGGRDLIKKAGLKPSKALGAVLGELMTRWVASDYTLPYDTMLEMAQKHSTEWAEAAEAAEAERQRLEREAQVAMDDKED